MPTVFRVKYRMVGAADTSRGPNGGKHQVPNSQDSRLVYASDDLASTAETNLRAAVSALHNHTLEIVDITPQDLNVI